LLVVSHDRRLLETVCEKLWVVGDGSAVAFEGGYREWRAAVANGWTIAGALEVEGARVHTNAGRSAVDAPRALHGAAPVGRGGRAVVGVAPGPGAMATPPSTSVKKSGKREKLSKEAYRRQKAAAEGELTRLGLRKNHLELALADPGVQSNFVELGRVTSELADIDVALAAAEDAWLELEERRP
jgi:hypothetical protein